MLFSECWYLVDGTKSPRAEDPVLLQLSLLQDPQVRLVWSLATRSQRLHQLQQHKVHLVLNYDFCLQCGMKY